MKIKEMIILLVLNVFIFFALARSQTTTNVLLYPDSQFKIGGVVYPKSFLEITNRPYVEFGDVMMVRVADAEWNAITNHYPDKIKMTTMSFK